MFTSASTCPMAENITIDTTIVIDTTKESMAMREMACQFLTVSTQQTIPHHRQEEVWTQPHL